MPNTKTQSIADDTLTPTVDPLIERADALYRWSVETCHQHDRFARMMARTGDNSELRAAQQLVRLCDATLCDMVRGYEKAASKGRPTGDDDWWHKANTLWLACREYVRRHDGCDRASRGVERGAHTPEQFGGIQVQYELEASALLAMRQAAEAYKRTRATLD